jgi:hypothetical protein
LIGRAARLAAIALLVGAAGAGAQRPSMPGGMSFHANANPSTVVAAEIAFARLGRDEGQWTAFRKTADSDAILFVPAPVNALSWLTKRANPPKSIVWAPDRVLMSCDGSYGVVHGHAEYPDGRKGGYVTLWRRQENGDYKWVLDWSTEQVEIAEDGVDGRIADCPARAAPGAEAPPLRHRDVRQQEKSRRNSWKKDVVRIAAPPPANGQGQSVDATLHWAWTNTPDGTRTLKVTARHRGEPISFIDDSIKGGQ